MKKVICIIWFLLGIVLLNTQAFSPEKEESSQTKVILTPINSTMDLQASEKIKEIDKTCLISAFIYQKEESNQNL